MGACTKRRAVAQSTRCGPLAVGVGRSLGHALTRPIACAVDRDHLSQCGPYMVGTDGGFVARSHDPTAGFVAKMHTRSDHHESMPVLVRIGASSTTPRDPPSAFAHGREPDYEVQALASEEAVRDPHLRKNWAV